MLHRVSSSLAIVLVAGLVTAIPARAVEDPVAIDSVAPQVVNVGQTVVLTGHGFSADPAQNTVSLNGRPATVVSASGGSLSFNVPAGATSGPVRVVTPAGSAISAVDVYVPPSPFVAADVESARRAEHGTGSVASILTANRVALLTFPGQAGRGIGVQLANGTFGSSTTSAKVAVYAPDGSALVSPTGFGNSGLFLERRALTQTGFYTVLIDPQGSVTGQVTITAFDIPSDAVVAAPLGSAVTVAAGVPGQNGIATFTGIAGQRVSVSLAASTFGTFSSSARVSVIKPDGATLIAPAGFGSSGTFLDTTVLPAAGLYQVLVDPQGVATGQVSVTVFDVPADPALTATPGGPAVALTTTVPGQNASATFSGAAGQRVAWKVVRDANLASNTAVYVRKPDGTTLASLTSVSASGSFIDTKVLAVSGTYTVFVDPGGASNGTLTLETFDVPADVSTTIAPGGPVTVTISVPGQNGLLTFDGVAGQRNAWKLVRDANLGSAIAVTVRKPDGTTLVSASSVSTAGTFLDATTLPATGSYTVFVDAPTWTTGTLTVEMFDVPTDFSASAPPGSTVNAAIGAPGQNAVLTFNGTAGDRLSWRMTRGSGLSASTTATVRNPDGTTLANLSSVSTSGTFIDTKVLPVSGTYTILINPPDWTVGEMVVETFAVPTDTLLSTQVGAAAVTVTTTAPGQNASVTFPGASGQRISIALTGSTFGSSASLSASLLNPDGTVLVATTPVSASGTMLGPVTLGASGTYTVMINPQGTATGSVAVRAADVGDAVAPATIGGGPVTVNTSTPGQNAAVTFPGTAVQRVAVNVTGSTYGTGSLTVSVLRPDGTTLVAAASVSGQRFVDAFVLPADGTYTVWLDPQAMATGAVTVEVLPVPQDVVLTAQPGQDAVATISAPGQNATIGFTATSGQRVAVALASTSSAIVPFTLRRPDGTTMWTFSVSSSPVFAEPVALSASGDYTVFVNPPGAATGTFTVRVYLIPADVTAPMTLDGTPVQLITAVPGQDAAATFTASAGQRVAVAMRGAGSASLTVQLRAPDGAAMWTESIIGNAEKFAEPLSLAVSGTYTLFVNPYGADLADVTLRAYAVPGDVTAGAALDGSPVALTTTVPGQNARISFTAAAGTPVLLEISGFPSMVRARLSNPDGSVLGTWVAYGGSSTPEAFGPVTLVAGGEHSLLLDPAGGRVGQMTIRLFESRPPATVAAQIGGAPARAITTAPGQVADVTFTGVAGQRISAVVKDGEFRDSSGGRGYSITLQHPDGTTVLDSAYSYGEVTLLGMVVLPVSGTYRVRIDPDGAAFGFTTVALLEVPADVALDMAIGASHVTVPFPVPGMTATISFTAGVGQMVRLAAAGVLGGWLQAEFLDPAGRRLCLVTVGDGGVGSCMTTSAGSHRIRLASTTPAVGTWQLQLFDEIAAPQVSTSPPLGQGQWTAAQEIYASWRTYSSVSITGYAVVFDRVADTDPGTVVSQVGSARWLAVAEEGVHFLHLRAIGAQGQAGPVTHLVIQVSRTPPTMVSVDSSSHPDPDTPVASLRLTAQFAATPSASGIAGYAVSLTHSPDDVPLGEPVHGSAFTTQLSSEGEWYMHVVAVDNAGNRSTPITRRIRADMPPSAPVIVSQTHPVQGTSYPHGGFAATWSAGEYTATAWAAVLDQSPSTVPAVLNLEPRITAQLEPGVWWLHVRGQDAAGAWGETAHFEAVVQPSAVAFTAPAAGSAVWGSVTIALTCPGPVTVSAAGREVGQATAVGGGMCEIGWDTTAWADGSVALTAPGSGEHLVRVGNGLDPFGRLKADYDAGLITLADYVRFMLYLGVEPELAPARYRDGTTLPSHSEVMAAVLPLWRALPPAVQSELEQWLTPTVVEAPPPGPAIESSDDCGWKVRVKNRIFTCVYETDHFKVHYIEGTVGPTDPGKPRPNFVQMISDALEQARTVYGTNMGYRIPGYRLQVFLDPWMPGTGGLALPEDGYCPGNVFGCPATLYLGTDYANVNRYYPWHEFFHFVQYEYMNTLLFADFQMNWWMEASAEWAMHRVEFWVNDSQGKYYLDLNDFLDRSDERFDRADSVLAPQGPEYGAFIVAEYMEERIGPDSIRQSWERLTGWNPPRPGDIVAELLVEQRIEGDFAAEIERFRQWAFVLDANGNSEVGFHDRDAPLWRNLATSVGNPPHDTVSLDGFTGAQPLVRTGSFDLEESGAKYVLVTNPQELDAEFSVTWNATDPDIKVSVLWLSDSGKPSPQCGGSLTRPLNTPNHIFLLNQTCPNALVTITYARLAGFWAHEADGGYRIKVTRRGGVLSTGSVEMGIDAAGNIMSSSQIGLRRHGDPGTESVRDPYWCYCEGWGVSIANEPDTWGAVYGTIDWVAGMNMAAEQFYATPTFASSTVNLGGRLRILQMVYPASGTPDLFELRISVTNTGWQPAPVRYRRAVSWALNVPKYGHTSYSTVQTLGGDTSFITGTTNDGISLPNPSQPLGDRGARGWFTDYGPNPGGALIELDLGTIEPGASKAFSLFYGVSYDETQALAAVQTVGAQAYALGQVPTDEGRTTGRPFTAVLAVNGSGL